MKRLHLEKCAAIIHDLSEYCLLRGAKKIMTVLDAVESVSILEVSAFIEHMEAADLSELKEELSFHRQREVEQYYWELGNDPEGTSDMCLIGMMTDRAEVTYSEGILAIKLWREE